VLFEIAIQVTRLNDRRRARRSAAEGWDSWDPDAPSPIDTSPSQIETRASPIGSGAGGTRRPEPVDRPRPGDS
jgi:sec-independent protein translocase protein TatC